MSPLPGTYLSPFTYVRAPMGPRNTNFRGRARGIIEKFLFVTLCWAIRAQPPPPPPPPPPFEEYIGREKKRKEKKTRHFNRETNNCCTVTTSIFRNDAKQNGTKWLDSRQRFNSCVSFEAPSILPRSEFENTRYQISPSIIIIIIEKRIS